MPTPNIFQGTRLPQHGQRQELQQIAALGGVRTSAQAPKTVPSRQAAASRVGQESGLNMGSPLEKLMTLRTDEAPVTSGLSVGPGAGPADPLVDPEMIATLNRAQRLAAVAAHARSPHLRYIASSLLRTMGSRLFGEE